MDVGGWLRWLGLEEYEAAFRENKIDDTVLPSLTAEDLKELGVGSVGHRRKLLDAISALRDQANEPLPPLARATIDGPTNKLVQDHPAVPLLRSVSTWGEAAGERRHITVMFCDLVDSTAISAKLDPEDWRDLVGSYLDAASAAVTEMGGQVAKSSVTGLWRCSVIQ
jgi:hypothetical protein